jgi:hypothetical protein
MSLPYPMQTFGRFRLGLALTYKLLHDRFGFDFGERYHRDLDYRIRTTTEIDTKLGGDRLFELHETFRECALSST